MKLFQKGFTLMELLVVVVVIGILAAAVLPKFNRALDTYNPSNTSTFSSQYFTYTLGATGMTAQALNQSVSYTLRIDYASGIICCSGEGCTQLNKDYPFCY